MKIYYLSILVHNNAGVLTRISGLIARRGYNIDSLSVCATEKPQFSRMTVSLGGNDKEILQLKRQLQKQVDVVCITELNNSEVIRELLLVKIAITPDKRSEIIEICTIFGAKTIDLSQDAIVLEMTGNTDKIDAFISLLMPYNIIELTRSGASALHRGSRTITDYIDNNN